MLAQNATDPRRIRYLCPAVTPVTSSFEPCNSHHNERHSAHPKLEKSYGLHDQFNHDDDGREHDHHQPQEVALTLRSRHRFFAFSQGPRPPGRAFDFPAPRLHPEHLNNAQKSHSLCQHLAIAFGVPIDYLRHFTSWDLPCGRTSDGPCCPASAMSVRKSCQGRGRRAYQFPDRAGSWHRFHRTLFPTCPPAS